MRLLAISLVACIPLVHAHVVGTFSGVNQKTGERPARRNINDVYAEGGPHWDLLVQSLIKFQKTNDEKWSSNFQISGIHGLPFKEYNSVKNVTGDNPNCGYCPHNQINFVTWHRPYVVLFEQELMKIVRGVASNYIGEQGVLYRAAAQTLRLPYWDWASSSQLPLATTKATLRINTSDGVQNLRNPFYSYQFQHYPFKDPAFAGYLANFNETKRCTIQSQVSSGVNNFTQANEILGSDGPHLQDTVYNVFTQTHSFEVMSSTAFSGPDFEFPHGTVHNDVACFSHPEYGGHMGDISWSAFDPLFFLHHANVDRLMAMWQAINYNNAMFNITGKGGALYGTAPGDITADSPLKPFMNDKGVFWTSNSVKETKTFGYTYPEIRDWELSGEELAKTVRIAVNSLYGSSIPKASRRSMRRPDDTPPTSKDYSVEISVDRADLDLPCSIELHLNGRKAGALALTSTPTSGMSYSTIPIRRTLRDANVKLEASGNVTNTLKTNLRAIVRGRDGVLIPADSVPSLALEIQERDFVPRVSDDEFPKYGDITTTSVKIAVGGSIS